MFVHWLFACFLTLGFNISMAMEPVEDSTRKQIKNNCGYYLGRCYCLYTCGSPFDSKNGDSIIFSSFCCGIGHMTTNSAAIAAITAACISLWRAPQALFLGPS